MYENKRNGMQAKLIRENTGKGGDGTYVLQYEDGKVNSVTASTFKRWWKKADIQPVEEVKERPKRVRNTKNNPDIESIKEYIFNKVNELGCNVIVLKPSKTFSIKLNGYRILAITYSSKTLWIHTRSSAIQDKLSPDKIDKPSLDYTFGFTEFNHLVKKDIDTILKCSYNYGLLKNNKKKESEEKKNGEI